MAKTIRHKRGDTWLMTFRYRNKNTGEVIPLTGYSGRMQVRDQEDNKILEATTRSGELIIDPLNGDVSLKIHYSVMENIIPGEYSSDLELTSPDGIRSSTDTFMLSIEADLTKGI